METEVGQHGSDLTGAAPADALRFDLLQAVRVIERASVRRNGDNPLVGMDGPPHAEPIRFVSWRTMRHPPAALMSWTLEDGGRARLSVASMGLIGPLGVLPTHDTASALASARRGDDGAVAFFDILTHRCTSLFVRAGLRTSPFVEHELSTGRAGGLPGILGLIAGLVGAATPRMRQLVGDLEETTWRYAGAFSRKAPSAVALGSMVSDAFGVPARVVQFMGKWIRLAREDTTCLGTRHATLSGGAVVGSSVWDVTGSIRVRVGRIGFDRFEDFLPGEVSHAKLMRLVRLYIGIAYDFDVQLVLAPGEAPATVLGAPGEGAGARLGYTTWIGRSDPAREVDDVVVREGAVA